MLLLNELSRKIESIQILPNFKLSYLICYFGALRTLYAFHRTICSWDINCRNFLLYLALPFIFFSSLYKAKHQNNDAVLIGQSFYHWFLSPAPYFHSLDSVIWPLFLILLRIIYSYFKVIFSTWLYINGHKFFSHLKHTFKFLQLGFWWIFSYF